MNQLNARELATVLAALRLWEHARTAQYDCSFDLGSSYRSIMHDIATDGGELVALASLEVDALCERLNCSEPDEPDDPAWDVESTDEEHERNNAALETVTDE